MELKPCPFCGVIPLGKDGKAALRHTDGSKWGAVSCCCAGPEVRTGYETEDKWRDSAVAAWNRRPIEDAKDAKIARLHRALLRLHKAVNEYGRAPMHDSICSALARSKIALEGTVRNGD